MQSKPVDPATFAHLIVNHGLTIPQRVLDQPRRALVRARTYGGDWVHVELDVTAVAKGWVCVEQEREGRDAWRAWVPAGWVRWV